MVVSLPSGNGAAKLCVVKHMSPQNSAGHDLLQAAPDPKRFIADSQFVHRFAHILDAGPRHFEPLALNRVRHRDMQ
ncbi:hypothetical protein GOC91_02815 [Sinorhizobium medicae]|nr:hypothetical protein [Sinorhizobium medicae]MDX0877835.1 hypothetical protein [Sinorhizobium medicae]